MSKLRKAAKGRECTLQIHPVCNMNPETVVLCHLPSGSGMSQKSPDWWAAYGCSDCHDVIDGRVSNQFLDKEIINECIMRGLYRTLTIIINEGLIGKGAIH